MAFQGGASTRAPQAKKKTTSTRNPDSESCRHHARSLAGHPGRQLREMVGLWDSCFTAFQGVFAAKLHRTSRPVSAGGSLVLPLSLSLLFFLRPLSLSRSLHARTYICVCVFTDMYTMYMLEYSNLTASDCSGCWLSW